METIVRAMQPLIVINPLAAIDGTIPSLDPKEYLPIEPTPPVITITPETPIPIALAAMEAAWVCYEIYIIIRHAELMRSISRFDHFSFFSLLSSVVYSV